MTKTVTKKELKDAILRQQLETWMYPKQEPLTLPLILKRIIYGAVCVFVTSGVIVLMFIIATSIISASLGKELIPFGIEIGYVSLVVLLPCFFYYIGKRCDE